MAIVPLTASRPVRLPMAVVAVVWVLLWSGRCGAAPAVVETEPLTPAAQGAAFRLPPGFEIRLVASEPQIQKPMNIAFDARGRLWVTHSIEYPRAARDGEGRDGLTILDDFGADGRARRARRFADGLNIPIGVLPLPDARSAIVWSIPFIWKLTDDDGDGRADRRDVLFGPFAFEDTHGNQNAFRMGADGWVYANHGFKNRSRIKRRGAGEVVLELDSGNGYRFRPDGSAIEQVTWGQVNPFGMDFDALDNRFNADCHTRPVTLLLRGGRYPSLFAAPNADYDDGLGPAPETTADDHGSTGIAAVAICDSPRWPDDHRGAAFVGNVVTNVVHRDPITWRGSSPWVEASESFLTCGDQWFRPVDLVFGPDGALYIADFYNCIIGHYEVDLSHPRRDRERGRIWRVTWTGAGQPETPPDLTGVPVSDLADLLASPEKNLRRLALEQLVHRGSADASVPALLRDPAVSEQRRALALRGLARLGRLTGADVAAASVDPSRLVRVHLVKAVESATGEADLRRDHLLSSLGDDDPFVRRAAAEALVGTGSLAEVPALVAALAAAPADDRQLAHALRMAVAAALRPAAEQELADMSCDAAHRPLLLDVVSRLPGRPPAMLGLRLIRDAAAADESLARVCGNVVRWGGPEEIAAAVAVARTACGTDIDRAASILEAMVAAGRREGRPGSPDDAVEAWGKWLLETVVALPPTTPPGDRTLQAALTVAERSLLPAGLPLAIAAVADRARPVSLRGAAAATALVLARDDAITAIVARLTDPMEPAAARLEFTGRLARSDAAAARDAIATVLAAAPAAEQQKLALTALADRSGAEAVLALVERGRVSARILQDPQIARRLQEAGVNDARARVDAITATLPAADDRVRRLIVRLAGLSGEGRGVADQGRGVFARHCADCHRVGATGGLVGPQLDGIGQRGVERLLEDILDPNRNVDAAFRTTILTLADGRVAAGLELRNDGDEVVLVESTGRQVRVPRAEVEETNSVPISPMPTGLADVLGEEAVLDLLAYLRRGSVTNVR